MTNTYSTTEKIGRKLENISIKA